MRTSQPISAQKIFLQKFDALLYADFTTELTLPRPEPIFSPKLTTFPSIAGD
jgi:hypothetical protein